MAGLTAIKRKGFKGGGADMSTVSAADLGISSDTSKREYTPAEKRQHQETRELNERINRNREIREDIKRRELEKDIYDVAPKKNVFQTIGAYNSDFQRRKNIELARKRAFQKYKDIEQYADIMDEYGLSGEELAAAVAANPGYGYDFSNLEKGKEFLGSNIGTSIEKYRPNLYDVNSPMYGFIGATTDVIRPDTQVTALNTLKKARDYTDLVNESYHMTNQEITDRLTELKNRGKTEDQINPFGNEAGGEGNQVYLPFQQVLPEEEAERQQKEFAYRFGDTQNVGADVTRASYIFNQGGRVPAAGGGIMNVVPRQGFFLGKIAKGIGKAVGSVAKAAGKVLKSDVGKMAMLAGGAYLAGGYLPGGGGITGGLANFRNLGANLLLKDPTGSFTGKNLSLMKMLGLSAALPFIPGINKAPPNEDIGMGERGGRLLDSKGNEALPADLRAEVIEAYKSGDADKIAAINDYYNFLPGANAVRLPDITPYVPYPNYADGGRIGFRYGKNYKKATSDNDALLKRAQMLVETGYAFDLKEAMDLLMPSSRKSEPSSSKPFKFSEEMIADMKSIVHPSQIKDSAFNITAPNIDPKFTIPMPEGWENARANGGRIKAQEGGLMNLGGMEKDYRNTGGFVDIGAQEKADDVPARLSVNEFVMTADAVRNAGGGDIDKGAEVMENMMKNLENGGRVSEESQGNTGAQEMFSVSERIGEVI